jgi:Ser/Thr protein kinase RdoA (MazF antagonist)
MTPPRDLGLRDRGLSDRGLSDRGLGDLGSIIRAFAPGAEVDAEFLSAEPYGNGHIHDTYRVFFAPAGSPARMILQRINTQVFRNPDLLMENIARVTAHLAAQLAADPDGDRRALTLMPTRALAALHTDQDGGLWRAWRYIPNAYSRDQIDSPAQAFQAARAFGLFQQQLASLPPPPLHATIPDFHHTPKRYAALEDAIARDAAGRVRTAQAEIAFARARQSIPALLVESGLPERVTHNDTKVNNVLFDERTGAGLCVIDLDTVMPGLAAYDFGDMVRTMTCPAPEDETDLARVRVDLSLFDAVARGYLSAAGSFLTPAEKDSLLIAGKLITFELALRFLTDHLNGDTYFKVHRPAHNLDRCRAQFALVESIEAQEGAMEQLVRSLK